MNLWIRWGRTAATLTVFFFLSIPVYSMLNIENIDGESNQEGLSHVISFSGEYQKSSYQKTALTIQWRSDWRLDQRHLFVVADAQFSQKDHKIDTQESLIHVRQRWRLNSILEWELFAQWEHNQFYYQTKRHLYGTGPRFLLTKWGEIPLNAGVSLMREWGSYYELEQDRLLLNLYLSTEYQWKQLYGLLTVYYQPILAQFHEYRLLFMSQIRIEMTQAVSFTCVIDYYYDRSTPSARLEETLRIRPLISVRF